MRAGLCFVLCLAAGDEVVHPLLNGGPLDELEVFTGSGKPLVCEARNLGQAGCIQAGVAGDPHWIIFDEQTDLFSPLFLNGAVQDGGSIPARR